MGRIHGRRSTPRSSDQIPHPALAPLHRDDGYWHLRSHWYVLPAHCMGGGIEESHSARFQLWWFFYRTPLGTDPLSRHFAGDPEQGISFLGVFDVYFNADLEAWSAFLHERKAGSLTGIVPRHLSTSHYGFFIERNQGLVSF